MERDTLYSIILVEDDSMERNILKKMIMSIDESINIYEADSENTALNIIKNNCINMFLIDINIKESSGLDLAMNIRDITKYEFSPLVFLTTHVEYITQAFKQTHCYDFILKPYNKNDVLTMLNKFIFIGQSNLKNIDKEIIIPLKNGILVRICINDIYFIEVKSKCCEVNTNKGVYSANNMSLKKIIKLIDSEHIIQSHRSFAINRNYICKIEKLDVKLSRVYFNRYTKTALLGYKFKINVISEFEKGKVLIC